MFNFGGEDFSLFIEYFLGLNRDGVNHSLAVEFGDYDSLIVLQMSALDKIGMPAKTKAVRFFYGLVEQRMINGQASIGLGRTIRHSGWKHLPFACNGQVEQWQKNFANWQEQNRQRPRPYYQFFLTYC